MQMKITLRNLSVITLFSLLVEHVGRICDIQLRPSYFLEIVATYAIDMFSFIGTQFARLSSFILHIQIEGLMITIRDFLIPLIDIITSPIWMVDGYIRQVWTYSYNSWQIYFGSMIIIIIIFCLVKKIIFSRPILIKRGYPTLFS